LFLAAEKISLSGLKRYKSLKKNYIAVIIKNKYIPQDKSYRAFYLKILKNIIFANSNHIFKWFVRAFIILLLPNFIFFANQLNMLLILFHSSKT
jgi:hypothetical protein